MLRDFTQTKVVAWNSWHGCHRCSPGCYNCYVFGQDAQYGKDASFVTKGKTTYKLPACPSGSTVKLCFTSDFFIEEADEWRVAVWDAIRERSDCVFITTTKRSERIIDCLPDWWSEGLENFVLSVSIENQDYADKRVPLLLAAPLKHRELFCFPLLGSMGLGVYLKTGAIECINVGGEMAPWNVVRPTQWDWVCELYRESRQFGVDFYFHQSGTKLMRGSCNFGASSFMQQQLQARELTQMLVRKFG